METPSASDQTVSSKYEEWAETAFREFLLDAPQYVAVDTETEGVEWHHKPFCVTMAWRRPKPRMELIGSGPGPKNVRTTLNGVEVVLPYGIWKNKYANYPGALTSHYFELDVPKAYDKAKEILRLATGTVYHNAKFDLQKLILVGLLNLGGLQSSRIHNTECIAHLLDEQRLKGLKFLAREILGEDNDEDKALTQARRDAKLTKADGYDKLPREVVIPYAIKDTEYTLRLFEKLYPQLQKHKDLLALYAQEQRLELVLLHMETMGMALNMEYLEGAVKQYAMNILQTELEIQDIAGEDFNPNSPKQVIGWFLAEGIALEGTARDVLETVSHPLAEKILQLRDLKKVHGTYLKPMLQEQRDGLMHPNFRQHGTKTGRMSSGGASD